MPAYRVATCPTCSSVVADGDRFCKQCGTEVSGISASITSGPGAPRPAAPASPTLSAGSPWEQVLSRLRQVTAGEFEIGRELGRGGMAAVFLGQDLALNRKVAIKVMAPGLMLGDDMVQRFRREAITIANLQHANIVTVHAVRQLEDLHFFVMQFVEGQSLDGVLRTHGRLPLALVLPIMHQVGSALAYAHRRGVIHRDVKPGNILLSGDGESLVTDFGIAKVAEGPTQTQTGMVVGTPSYMSPEQCFATELTGASDQYSLAIVAYQMLAGRVPFSGGTFEIMKGHTTDPVPSLREAAPDVPPEIEAAIVRMLAKKPSERFPSFGEALAALGAVPLPEHGPLRADMIRLAAVEERREALGDLLRTPSGPVSGSRPGGEAARTPRTPAPTTIPVAIAIAPLPASIEVGESVTLRATVRGGDGELLHWSADTPDIVQVDEVSGELLALAQGDAMVRAQVGVVVEHIAVHVVAPRVAVLQVTPLSGDLHVGDHHQLTATARDRRGEPLLMPVTWQTVGASVTIAPDGTLQAVSVGRTDIIARCEDVADTVVVHVLPARVATLDIIGPAKPIEVGDAVTLRGMACDASGLHLPDRLVSWAVRPSEAARVDAAGVFTALTDGSAEVVARCEDIESSCTVRILPAHVASVQLTGVPALLRDGDRFALTAVPRDARGTVLTRPAQWTTSDASVATVDATGTVHTHTAGSAEIAVTIGEMSASVSLVVHGTHPLFAAANGPPDPETAAPESATAVLPGLESSVVTPSSLAAAEASLAEAAADAAADVASAKRAAKTTAAPATKAAAMVPSTAAATAAATAATAAATAAAAPAVKRAGTPPSSAAAGSKAEGVSPIPTANSSTATPRSRPPWIYAAALVPVALIGWFVLSRDGGSASGTPTGDSPATVAEAGGTSPGNTSANPANTPAGSPNAPSSRTPPTVTRDGAPATTVPTAPTGEASGGEGAGGRGTTPNGSAAPVVRLTPPASSALRVAQTVQLRASTQDPRTGRDVPGTIRFSSSNRNVASVDARTGLVTGIGAGAAVITADGGVAGRSTVTLTVQTAAPAVAERPADNPPARSESPPVVTAPPANTPPANTPPAGTTSSAEANRTPSPPAVSQAQLAGEARAIVEAFARAIESRDIGRVRSVFPDITSGYASQLAELFSNSKSLQVNVRSMRVSSPSGEYDGTSGARTNTSVQVTIVVTPTRGRAQPTDDTWPVILQRSSGGWRLLQVASP